MSFMSNKTEFQWDFPRKVVQVVTSKLTATKNLIKKKMSLGLPILLVDF